jgi:hypothetical protein
MRRLLLTALLLAGCASRPSPAPGQGVAAVAFRDEVPAWQRVGTRGFSRHYLDDAYDQVFYLEADSLGPSAPAELQSALTAAARENRAVDLFLLVNGGRQLEWVRALPDDVRRKLRLVYDTGAGGGWQEQAWTEAGAQAYVSHPGSANLAPFFYVDFLRGWADGKPARDAVADANASLHERLSGFSASLILKASGFPARAEDLPFWEEATLGRLRGDGAIVLR